MSNESIFFSYSRDDSDFVLQLAKNLRRAGAKVWLDQLDIAPGVRWDKAIEDALTQSKILLVILSKKSVESDNVLDEVSFALEEGKTVVPVLLENCEIPFRLRRLQYADFTGNHDRGVQTLIKALHLNFEVAAKLSDFAAKQKNEGLESGNINSEKSDKTSEKQPDNKDIKEHGKPITTQKSNEQSPTEARQKSPSFTEVSSKKTGVYKFFIVLLGVVILAATLWKLGLFEKDRDSEMYEQALQRNTIAEFEYYINQFPEGKFIEQARDSIFSKNTRLNQQKQRELIEKEKTDWENALNRNDIESYQNYINKYPNGSHLAEAKQKINEFAQNLNNIKQDNDAWTDAVSKASVDALLNYYTDQSLLGTHKTEALEKIKALGNKGWLYCGRFSGDKMTESIFKLIWRAENFTSNDKLMSGDVVMLKSNESARRTYKYPDNRNAGNVNTESVKKDNKVYVISIKPEGNALIAEVIY